MFVTIRQNGCWVLIWTLVLTFVGFGSMAQTQSDIDKAFSLQGSAPKVQLQVDGGVVDTINESWDKVRDRHITNERERTDRLGAIQIQGEADRDKPKDTSSSKKIGATGSPKSAEAISKTSSRFRRYACTVYCLGPSGPRVTHTIEASSRSEATQSMNRLSDDICRRRGFANASQRQFSENQCISE